MNPSRRTFLAWWICGLVAFGIAIYFHLPLITEAVPGGIADHQSAPDAATVDAIQHAWRLAGVQNQAGIAMIVDLVFIGIYGIGCVLAGLYYRTSDQVILRVLGWIALASGVIFLITDYGETIAQFIQFMRFSGDDGLAWLASTLRPFKMASFVTAFLSIVAALIVERRSRHSA